MAVWHFPLQKLPGPTVLSPFLYLQLGSANLMIFGSPEPAPYSQLVPNSAREHSPPPVRPGQGHSWGRLGCASTGPQVTFVPRLPLLLAWDVTDRPAGKAASNDASSCSVPCDQQRGISAHSRSKSVWLQRHRHFAARGETDSKRGSLECAKT